MKKASRGGSSASGNRGRSPRRSPRRKEGDIDSESVCSDEESKVVISQVLRVDEEVIPPHNSNQIGDKRKRRVPQRFTVDYKRKPSEDPKLDKFDKYMRQENKKNHHLQLDNGAPRKGSLSFATYDYNSELNGLLSLPPDRLPIFDGVGMVSSFVDKTIDEVWYNITHPHYVPPFHITYRSIQQLGIQAGVQRLYDEWTMSRNQARRVNDDNGSMAVSGRDILIDAAIIPSEEIADANFDSPELEQYRTVGGFCYYNANVQKSSRLLTYLKNHLYINGGWEKANSTLAFEAKFRRIKSARYPLQMVAFCRAEVKGVRGRRRLDQFAPDGFIITATTLDLDLSGNKSNDYIRQAIPPTLLADGISSDSIVVLYTWENSIMRGTHCVQRCIMIAQELHFKKHHTRYMVINVPTSVPCCVSNTYAAFGKQMYDNQRDGLSTATNTRSPSCTRPDSNHEQGTPKRNDIPFKNLTYLFHTKANAELKDDDIVPVHSNTLYSNQGWNIFTGLNCYTSSIPYEDEVPSSVEAIRDIIRSVYKDVLIGLQQCYPVHSLSPNEVEDIGIDIASQINDGTVNTLPEISSLLYDKISDCAELDIATVLSPMVCRFQSQASDKKINLRTLPLSIMHHMTVKMKFNSPKCRKYRGDSHLFYFRCKLCKEDMLYDCDLDFGQLWGLAPAVAALHCGLLSKADEAVGNKTPHYDLYSTRNELQSKLCILRKLGNEGEVNIKLCTELIRKEGTNVMSSNHQAMNLIDAARIDLHSNNYDTESLHTSTFFSVVFENVSKASADRPKKPQEKLIDRQDVCNSHDSILTQSYQQRLVKTWYRFVDDLFRKAALFNVRALIQVEKNIRNITGRYKEADLLCIKRLSPYTDLTLPPNNKEILHWRSSSILDRESTINVDGTSVKFPLTRVYIKATKKIEYGRCELEPGTGWRNDVEINNYVGATTKIEMKVREYNRNKMSEVDLVHENYHDKFLITHATRMKLFVGLNECRKKDLPRCLQNDFFHQVNTNKQRYYVIQSDMRSIKNLNTPFAKSLRDSKQFIDDNEYWIAENWIVGLFPKEFVELIEEKTSWTTIDKAIMKDINQMYKDHDNDRVAKLQLYSRFPTMYRVEVEGVEDQNKWIYLTPDDFDIDTVLSGEPHNIRFFKSVFAQGTKLTLFLGAGKKEKKTTTIEEDKDCIRLPNKLKHFEDEESSPKDVFWNVDGDFNLCAKAAVVNLVAALGDQGKAQLLQRLSLQSPMSAANELGVGLPKSGKGVWDEVDYALWLFTSLCGEKTITMMKNLRWTASEIVTNVGVLAHPVLLEILGVDMTRSHVIVVFQGHIYCGESFKTYPLCVENLNFSCGNFATFDRAKRIVAIVPSPDLKKVCNNNLRAESLSSIKWDECELSRYVSKKKHKRRKK